MVIIIRQYGDAIASVTAVRNTQSEAEQFLREEKRCEPFGTEGCFGNGSGVQYTIHELPLPSFVVVGQVNDATRAFGLFNNGKAEEHLTAMGYDSHGGKHWGEGTGRNSTQFQIVPVESPDTLVPRM